MKVLMCPPAYFAVAYEINPWMRKAVQVNRETAQKQWEALVRVYQQLGIEVLTVEPVDGLPDMVFTANAGFVMGQTAILSNFRFPQRQPEAGYFSEWFEKAGYTVVKLAAEEYFEGQGEALWCGKRLVAGYGFRANREGSQAVEGLAAGPVAVVRLTDPKFYHLDTCFFPINEHTAAYYPAAFDVPSRELLQDAVVDLIEVTKEDAEQFACNSVVHGKNIVMPKGAVELPRALAQRGFEVIQLDMSEFKKSGGGVRCLTLNLDA